MVEKIIFNGNCSIGSNSYISIGEKGSITFGKEFSSLTSLKIVSYYKIFFEDYVRIGWDCLFLDTDFHKMKKLNGTYTKGYGEIIVGERSWIGSKCIILKNTHLPKFTTVSTGSILNKKIDVPEYSVIGSDNSIIVKSSNIYRDINDDTINYC